MWACFKEVGPHFRLKGAENKIFLKKMKKKFQVRKKITH